MRQWGVNNLSKVVAQQRHGRVSNPRTLDRKSDALPLSHRSTLLIVNTDMAEALSECLPLFDVFCKRSLNFINRCLVSDNAVVSFVARHCVFQSRMFSCIGRNFQFCCRLRACDLVNRAHYRPKHVIDKASTDRLDHNVQCCADLIRGLNTIGNTPALEDEAFTYEPVQMVNRLAS